MVAFQKNDMQNVTPFVLFIGEPGKGEVSSRNQTSAGGKTDFVEK